MATTYHEVHVFAGGLARRWSVILRKHELIPSTFCTVCGRKKDHILHATGAMIGGN